MDSIIAIEIAPVMEDNYYKIIVYDLEADDAGRQIRFVREIYHTDTIRMAANLLHRLAEEGDL